MVIVYFSPIMWDDLKQRPQHIAEQLALGNKVFYIEPSISFLKGCKNKLYKKSNRQISENLFVVRPSGLWRFPKSLEVFDLLKINVLYEKWQLKKIFKESDVVWIGSPIFYPIITDISSEIVIYDKMDDYVYLTKNKFLKYLLNKYEKKLNKIANKIFVSCKKFYSDSIYKEKVVLLNNGVDENFAKQAEKYLSNLVTEKIGSIKLEGGNVFGYVGTIDRWFDFDAIKLIVEHDKKNHVILLGRNNIEEIEHDRIHYFKAIDKSELAAVIKKFDICLYTFKKDEFLDTINPVKIYEYLALRKKTLAVLSSETMCMSSYISTYSNHFELKNILNDIFIENIDWESVEEFVNESTWKKKKEEIERILLSELDENEVKKNK